MRYIMAALSIILCLSVQACVNIQPDPPGKEGYSTENPTSYLDYSIYMGKQISAYANQLTTRMGAVKNSGTADRDQEISMAKESLLIMEDVLEEVEATMPAKTALDDREKTIEAMEAAVSHMSSYGECLEDGEDVSQYADDFQNDFNNLTGMANLYYQ